jgi:hypothetical protein
MVGVVVSRASATARGRRAAEADMLDSCEIRAPRTLGTMNPATGVKPVVLGVLRYSGPCRIQSYEAYPSEAKSGQHQFTTQRHRVDIPVGEGPVFVEDEVTITGSSLSPDLVGRHAVVAGVLSKSAATAQRLQVDQIVA